MLPALALLAAATALPTDAELERRAGAWDRSVELERSGDARGAERVLVDGWGPAPESYEVTVRLAWLALKLDRPTEAVVLYRRAQALEGAGPEATRGLASALIRDGFVELAAGERERARARFREALALFPSDPDAKRGESLCRTHPFALELWVGGLALSSAEPTQSGGFAFSSLRWRASESLRLRAAYRVTVSWQEARAGSAGRGPGARSRSTTRTFTRQEVWAGLGFESAPWRGEALGVGLFQSGAPWVPGQAARLSFGNALGLAFDEAALFPEGGTNVQLAPRAFAWPARWLGLAGGVRLTLVDQRTLAAAELGLSLSSPSVELHASGLVGRAMAPVLLDVPLVVDVPGELVGGGAASLLLRLGPSTKLGVSAEGYASDDSGDAVRYGSVALGIVWSPEQ